MIRVYFLLYIVVIKFIVGSVGIVGIIPIIPKSDISLDILLVILPLFYD